MRPIQDELTEASKGLLGFIGPGKLFRLCSKNNEKLLKCFGRKMQMK